MPIIYHVTSKAQWQAAQKKGLYEAASLTTEGFIHCSEAHQLRGVLKRYFRGQGDLVRLTIDTNKLTAPLQYDLAPSVNEQFPHIYGPLNLDAVVKEEEERGEED